MLAKSLNGQHIFQVGDVIDLDLTGVVPGGGVGFCAVLTSTNPVLLLLRTISKARAVGSSPETAVLICATRAVFI